MSTKEKMAFIGSFTNRLSWLRQDYTYLDSALKSPHAKFIFLSSSPLNPLVVINDNKKENLNHSSSWRLLTAPWTTASKFLKHQSLKPSDSPALNEEIEGQPQQEPDPIVVFLGVDDRNKRQHEDKSSAAIGSSSSMEIPYFGMQVTSTQMADYIIKETTANEPDSKVDFMNLRSCASKMTGEEVALAGAAKAMLYWNQAHRFCPGCGSQLVSMFGGWKRGITDNTLQRLRQKINNEGEEKSKTTLLKNNNKSSLPPCISPTNMEHTFQYPRSDACVIMAVRHPTEDSLLLGSNYNFPDQYYSCLAGFIEPGESIEEAVAREVWEEAGVELSDVKYFASQPWPFPGTLMIGAFAVAKENFIIRTDLDKELRDARFFSRQEIKEALSDSTRIISRQDIELLDKQQQQQPQQSKFKLPPPSTIAHQLISAWAHDKDTF